MARKVTTKEAREIALRVLEEWEKARGYGPPYNEPADEIGLAIYQYVHWARNANRQMLRFRAAGCGPGVIEFERGRRDAYMISARWLKLRR